ncbi:MAG: hypothetical protein OXC80_09385 [Gammaproteobacteria bacterium]|nr:hypothetical protein [Gammaproteobacteria bacterium]
MTDIKKLDNRNREDPLDNEKRYLRKNIEELQKKYPGKYLVIQGLKIFGAFETYDQGVEYGISHIKGTPFLVRNVLEPDDKVADIPALALEIPL